MVLLCLYLPLQMNTLLRSRTALTDDGAWRQLSISSRKNMKQTRTGIARRSLNAIAENSEINSFNRCQYLPLLYNPCSIFLTRYFIRLCPVLPDRHKSFEQLKGLLRLIFSGEESKLQISPEKVKQDGTYDEEGPKAATAQPPTNMNTIIKHVTNTKDSITLAPILT